MSSPFLLAMPATQQRPAANQKNQCENVKLMVSPFQINSSHGVNTAYARPAWECVFRRHALALVVTGGYCVRASEAGPASLSLLLQCMCIRGNGGN